ncbi:MAG: outer membrane lipoprotein-sorting protein [Cyclobacteriaceae bacterium]|nr:outer membrane lipoprotein-sorting protein [Cyclobacteriaceae bacterium]
MGRYKRIIRYFAALLLWLNTGIVIGKGPDVSAQDAGEIIRKVDQKMRGEYSYQELEMKIVRPEWERSITMKNWSKGSDYALILITAPAKEKGQVFLKRGKEMWNWVPSIERMIKIPPSMMMQSWMGSDFTNDDLVRESSIIQDYDHYLDGEVEYDGVPCWKIELIPKEEAPVVWGKILTWIDKDYNQRKVEYYDEDGYLINTMYLSGIREMGDRIMPTHWEMIPADEEGKKTVINVMKAEFNDPIPDSFFSQQNMRMIR